jgi:hypothetical protein
MQIADSTRPPYWLAWLATPANERTWKLADAEMTFREGTAGAGFEIALEGNSLCFRLKLNYDKNLPRPIVDGVTAWTVVVPVESLFNVSCGSNVMMRRVRFAAEYVHKAPPDSLHSGGKAQIDPSRKCR